MEEMIFLVLIILSLFSIYCFYKIFDKKGLIYSMILLDILAFILTFKITIVFKTTLNLGIIPLIASFTAIYIIIYIQGNKEINKCIKLTLCSNITFAILLILINYLIPAITETVSINIEGTFGYNYKLLILYPFIIAASQYLIGKIYTLVTQIQNNLFLSISVTYIIVAVVSILLYYVLGYINIMSFRDSIFVGISSYIMGLIITLINIIFAYINIKKKVIK